MEIAVDVGLDRAVEVLVGQVFDAFGVFLERGIVDEDIELSEFFDGARDRFAAELRIGDVAGDENAAPSLLSTASLVFSASACSVR